MMETGYEGPFPKDESPDQLSARTSRLQTYCMLLAGGFGFTYGANNTFSMVNDGDATTRTWQRTLTIPGAFHQMNAGGLIRSLDWWLLIPGQARSAVTAGFGQYGGSDYSPAAMTVDGQALLAYAPTPRVLTVNMARFAGPVTAFWYDPTNGRSLPIAEGPLNNAGSRQFASPASNGAGDGDFALVLQTNNRPNT
jgi:hypothetical protein